MRARGMLPACVQCAHPHILWFFFAFSVFHSSNQIFLSSYSYIHLSTNTCIMSDLKAWLEEVSADSGTDVTGHLDSLTTHGTVYITRFYFSFSLSLFLSFSLFSTCSTQHVRKDSERSACAGVLHWLCSAARQTRL